MAKKLNILLFGAGLVGRKVLPHYAEKFNILAFVDNDPKKSSGTISGIKIIKPEQISDYDYEYIVISSTSIEEIHDQLVNLHVKEEQIKHYVDLAGVENRRFPWDALVFLTFCFTGIVYISYKIIHLF